MNIIIGIIIAIAGIVVLLLLIGLFLKKNYSVGTEVTVNKPKKDVFEYLKLLKNQNKFSVWATMDPDMKTEFRGTDGTAGFISAWESLNKNVGKGEQEIIKIVDGEKIDYEIRFIKPFASTSPAYITTSAVDDYHTKVHWEFTGKMKYPMNLMLLFMNMEKMISNDLKKGLQNLKAILEK
jgi:Polyketide cyclase / dehydrase and lipid transport